jgi:hypothetical protein
MTVLFLLCLDEALSLTNPPLLSRNFSIFLKRESKIACVD